MAGETGAFPAGLQTPPDRRRQRRFTLESHSRASSGDPAFHQWQVDPGDMAARILCGVRWTAFQARPGRSDGRVGSGSFMRNWPTYRVSARLAFRLRIAGPAQDFSRDPPTRA